MRHSSAFTVVLALALGAAAGSVDLEQARTAVGNWLGTRSALGCRLGDAVSDARTCRTEDGASFHVVRLSGGGFVVTSTDTRIEPIVAFSDGVDLAEGDGSPLWSLLKGDLAARAKSLSRGSLQSVAPGAGGPPTAEEVRWANLLRGGASLQSVQSVSDVRVEPLVDSRWGQGGNSVYLNQGAPCYSYYTPNNYDCGCVATALAQLMRFHRHPAFVQAVSRTCAVDGVQRTFAMKGGTYDYDAMKLVPEAYRWVAWYDGGATEAQRQAIGRLTYDCGVAMQMNWTSGGGASGGGAAHLPLKTVFGYASAHTTTAGLSDAAYRDRILRTNLDAGYPVMLGVSGPKVGHEVLADGYGYSSSVLYTHLNMGWSGLDDAWYALPAIDAASSSFNVLAHAVYNVFPDRTGEIVSGRVVTAGGAPVAGATVLLSRNGYVSAEKTTDARGVFAFIVPSPSSAYSGSGYGYGVRARLGEFSSTNQNVSVRASADSPSVTLNVGSNSYDPAAPVPICGNVLCDDLVLSSLPAVADPVFTPADCRFYPETNVTVSCATAGAVVRYTLDGTEPTGSSPVYAGPLRLTATTTVKVRAFKDGANPSAVVAAVYTYDLALGGVAGDFFERPIPISGAAGTLRVPDNADYTLQDGEPRHSQLGFSYYVQAKSIWYLWTAPGSGTMTFTTECVHVATNGYTVTTSRMPTLVAVYRGESLSAAERVGFSATGSSAPLSCSVMVEEGCAYRIVGAVMGDSYEGAFTLSWSGTLEVPAAKTTTTTDVPVPHAWLDARLPGARTAAEYEALAHADADGDGFATWQEYLCGTDPAAADDLPRCRISLEGAAPAVTHNVVVPEAAAQAGWRAALQASDDLAVWEDVDGRPREGKRFFKVVVRKR